MLENTRLLRRTYYHLSLACAMLLVSFIGNASGQTTQFTYQGKLADSGNPASGQYDFKFKLYDTATVGTGTQQGGDVSVSSVQVTAGIFTVQLDFGACASCFNGAARFLEIAVKQTSGSTYTTLGPRQPVTSDPYAIRSLNSVTADGLSVACVGCITSSQIAGVNGSVVMGAIPVAAVPPGSGNYIQNGTSPQVTSNFNISGDGTAGGTLSGNTVNAATQYNTGGSHVLSQPGSFNLFAGRGAGANNTNGNAGNSFFGINAGNANTTAIRGSFFGASAGLSNTTGGSNAFFGIEAGKLNTMGAFNSFFGDGAGMSNTTASNNSFFGFHAGQFNTTQHDNTFIGTSAGQANGVGDTMNGANNNTFAGSNAGLSNTTGGFNSFFGYDAGQANTTGFTNSFFGTYAGLMNTTASGNSFFGYQAGFSNTGFQNSFFGTFAGGNNTTAFNNSFFGHSAGFSNTTEHDNTFIGSHAGYNNGTNDTTDIAHNNTFVGSLAGQGNTTGGSNSFFGGFAGFNVTTGQNNTFIGAFADFSTTNPAGDNDTLFGANTKVSSGVSNGTAIGYSAQVTQSNSLVLGSINGVNSATADSNVGIGTTAPNARLHIAVNGGNILLGDAGCASGLTGVGFASALSGCTNYSLLGNGTDTIISRPSGGSITLREGNTTQVIIASGGAAGFLGTVAINTLGAGPGLTLCRNSTTHEISACSSSLRYKDHLAPFTSGFDLIDKLRPITFNWKQSGERDLGLAAEEVAVIEPLLVTYNDKGQVEGVKYDRINVVLVNAIKQQQARIEAQQREIQALKERQHEFDSLKRLVCLDHPAAALCKSN